MTVRQHLRSIRRRIVANAKEQGRLARARTFRRRRSAILKRQWKHAQASGSSAAAAGALHRYRKSLGLGRQINSRLDTFEARERRLRRGARKVRRRIAPKFAPAWNFSEAAMDEVQRKAGLPRPPISSEKRAANHPLSISNPGSDHNTANTSSYARDYATFDGCSYAQRLAARAAGQAVCGTWGNGSYHTHEKTFNQQIIWNAPDGSHRDHVHHGMRRTG